ncbi:MAG TPA: TerC family protein [Abditibacteriaceae bacterium]|jgi:tellurite resistance protein TerC
MDNGLWIWIGFNVFVLMMLALDLGVFHRDSHEVKFKEALGWSAAWISLALCFNALIFWKWQQMVPTSDLSNREAGLAFLTGYLIEKALSVDNIFVFLMIFAYFKVPAMYQHKVLFWGIIGALVMRAICIAVGAELLKQFHWLIYVFGAFLILTGIKMLRHNNEKMDPGKNPILRLFRRVVPTTDEYHGDKFWIIQNGRRAATPLFVALLMVEISDLIFAVDSIPAILAVTQDTFLVYTSNVFAILGLRSLYFALAGIVDMFRFLHIGLSGILVFVGTKMLIVDIYKIPVGWSLATVGGILAVSIIASIMSPAVPKPLPEPQPES